MSDVTYKVIDDDTVERSDGREIERSDAAGWAAYEAWKVARDERRAARIQQAAIERAAKFDRYLHKRSADALRYAEKLRTQVPGRGES